MADNIPAFLRAQPVARRPLLDKLSGGANVAVINNSPQAFNSKKMRVQRRGKGQLVLTNGEGAPRVIADNERINLDTPDQPDFVIFEASKRETFPVKLNEAQRQTASDAFRHVREGATLPGEMTIGHFVAQSTKPNTPGDKRDMMGAIIPYDVKGRMLSLPYVFPTVIEADAVSAIMNRAVRLLDRGDQLQREAVALRSNLDFGAAMVMIGEAAFKRVGKKMPEANITRAEAERLYKEAGFIAPENLINVELMADDDPKPGNMLEDVIARIPLAAVN